MLRLKAELLKEDDFNSIHQGSLKIMKEVGIEINHKRTRERLAEIGCNVVNNDRVKFPNNLVKEFIREMKILGQEKIKKLKTIKRPRLIPHATGQALFAHDLDSDEIRKAIKADLIQATRLVRLLPGVYLGHPSFIPQDVHPLVRDIHTLSIVARFHPNSREVEIFSEKTIVYFLEIAEVIRGDKEKVLKDPPFSYHAYGTSPFRFGDEGLKILWQLIDSGVQNGISVGHAMPVLGASTPITLASYLVALAAEGLIAAILNKAITGKTRFFLGGPCALDIKTFSSVQSSPEAALLNLASLELARYYGDPEPFYPYALSTDAKFPDVQAGLEKAYKVILALASGSREIVTGLGVLAQASAVSVPQILIDYDFCMMCNRMLEGIAITEDKLALDLILKKGLQADFIATEHTVTHYREEIFVPQCFDRRALSSWNLDRKGMLEHAKERVRELLAPEPEEFLTEKQIKEIKKIVKKAEAQLT